MPQFLSPEVHRLGRQFRRDFLHFRLDKETVLKKLGNVGYSFVGMGSEHVIFRRTQYSRNAVSVNFAHPKNQTAAEVEFHSQRIFWLLFPHNFPKFLAVYGTENSLLASVTYRQFVESILICEFERYQDIDKVSKYPFKYVIQTLKSLGYPVIFDYSEGNYSLGQDGGTYYNYHSVTNLANLPEKQQITLELQLLDWMMSNRYSNTEIEQVIKSYRRIMELSRITRDL